MFMSPCGVFCVMVAVRRMAFTAFTFSLPPRPSTTLASSALPSAVEPEGASLFLAAPGAASGSGMVMSIVVTGPKLESGLSNSAALPTTSTASLSLCRYFLATRFTSAAVTWAMPVW